MRFIVSVPVMMFTVMSVVACAPRQLNPGSETVKVSYSKSVARNCKFVGDVSSENIHGDMSLTASQQERELDDINFLKNEGKKLGANLVILTKHDEVITEKQFGKIRNVRRSITYDIQGKAYSCATNVTQFKQSLSSIYLQHSSAAVKK